MKYNKEKIFTLILLSMLLFSVFTVYAHSSEKGEPKISAKASVLYDAFSKEFIFLKNADQRLPMASTTKIMTAIVIIENCDIEETVTVSDDAIGVEGSSIYLKKGEEMTIRSLLYALMLRSANDAAVALACATSGTVENFAVLMNETAEKLGLSNTSFANPHGLDAKNHYTTARDLALLSAYALDNPTFTDISSTKKIIIDSSLESRLLINHNKLLSSYEGCIGVKTGYTRKSGRSLVSAAQRNGITLVAVTINAPDDWNDHKKLLDYGFSALEYEGEYSI